jgi:hypothetical protein
MPHGGTVIQRKGLQAEAEQPVVWDAKFPRPLIAGPQPNVTGRARNCKYHPVSLGAIPGNALTFDQQMQIGIGDSVQNFVINHNTPLQSATPVYESAPDDLHTRIAQYAHNPYHIRNAS